MNILKLFTALFLLTGSFNLKAQNSAPTHFKNPILTGFNPDPSICRANDDYYMVTSSFTWYPGLPIYHSKDLVNWELIGHAINRPNIIDFAGLSDNDGIWAPTIRYHDGLFYLITTVWKGGGNFYITATNPAGPWSDPVWLNDAPGIDPSLLWDDDGKCYYTGTMSVTNKSWAGQVAIWIQELDIEQRKLVGERKIITYGHANNAKYAEGPHLYKIKDKYLLLMAEGGTDYHHAVSVHHSKSILGPYVADDTNPVLSHRQLGSRYPIQAIGHSDLVQTQNGDWYAVVLGKRVFDGKNPLARETFLCKIDFENGTPIYNAGYGRVLIEQERPNLPWTPIRLEETRDEFDADTLASKWYFVKVPQKKFYDLNDGQLALLLQPTVIDDLENSAMIIQKTKHHHFTVTVKLDFRTRRDNEQAGLVLYRTVNGYYSLLKDRYGITLTKKHLGKKEIVAQIPYSKQKVYLSVTVNESDIKFGLGETLESMTFIGSVQNIEPISDNRFNRFNGTGIGVYATSNGKKSTNKVLFDWFEYKVK